MRLDRFDNADFDRGRPRWVEMLWLVVSALFVACWLPGSRHRVWLLRLFGARVGAGVVVKAYVRVKFPWRLSIGDYTWIGESAWIDNLARVEIGSHCCISQGVYLCTGSHAYWKEQFDLVTRPIAIGDRSWLCAKAVVAPGCTVGEGAMLGLGSVATGDLAAWTIHAGCPATRVRERSMTSFAESEKSHF